MLQSFTFRPLYPQNGTGWTVKQKTAFISYPSTQVTHLPGLSSMNQLQALSRPTSNEDNNRIPKGVNMASSSFYWRDWWVYFAVIASRKANREKRSRPFKTIRSFVLSDHDLQTHQHTTIPLLMTNADIVRWTLTGCHEFGVIWSSHTGFSRVHSCVHPVYLQQNIRTLGSHNFNFSENLDFVPWL